MILVCAATGVEARACRRGLARAHALDRFEVLRTGIGADAAERGLRARLASITGPSSAEAPTAIVSTGFAGAKSDDLALGEWVLAEVLPEPLKTHPWLNGLLSRTLKARPVRCDAVDAVDTHRAPEEVPRARQAESLPQVVDMESLRLASVAAELGLPFACLRLISDTPAHPIPDAIATFVQPGPKRSKRWPRALRQGLGSPTQLIGFARRTLPLTGQLMDGWERLGAALPRGSPGASEKLARVK